MMTPPSLSPSRPRDVERARQLVLQHGWNAAAYQILNPGIAHWFSAQGDAVVGFVARHGVRVVAGAPICSDERLVQVVREFEASAVKQNQRVCYFGAAERLHAVLQDEPSRCIVALGAQPVWEPQDWPNLIATHASLRAQLNRARNKGVSVCELGATQAEAPKMRRALISCLRQWLQARPLPPLRFLIEPQTLGNLRDRRIWIAGQNGSVVGFLVASPVPLRNGWLVEQVVRANCAPNGTAELLIDSAIRAMNETGSTYVTLGLVPLSQHASSGDCNPLWLKLTLAWLRAHGRRFYNFDGLDAFKSKFRPQQWETVYAVSREPQLSPRTYYAIASAFSQGSPMLAVARGLGKAIHQEVAWLANKPFNHG